MTKVEAREEAIRRIKGEYVTPGTLVGSYHDERIWEFLEARGDIAVCRINDDIREFPSSDIFDVRKVINVANHLLNVGFWEEGMESLMLEIK